MDSDKETYEELAIRETKEEAGLDVLELKPITQFWSSPGGSKQLVKLFCARVDSTQVQAGDIHGLDHEHEDIRIHVIDLQEAFDMVKERFIDQSPAIIALQWLELNKGKVFV
jgi:ADP-ribose pyrophosphatase